MSHPENQRNVSQQGKSPSRSVFDPARMVVILLGVGALAAVGSIVFSAATPTAPPAAGTAQPVTTEAKVFEGKQFKYTLHTPEGTPWRALPAPLVKQRIPGAELALERVGSDVGVAVIASEVPKKVSLEAVLTGLTQAVNGVMFEEISRAPIQKGTDRGILMKATRSAGKDSAEVLVLALIRDGVLYVVTGTVPLPAKPELSKEVESIVSGFEPPPPEVLTEAPKPPFNLPAPKPAAGITDPALALKSADELSQAAQAAAAAGKHAEAAAILQLAAEKGAEVKYNLACYEAVSARPDAAIYWLQRAAAEDGVDSDWADEDSDLELLRSDKRWPTVRSFLRKSQRYWAKQTRDVEVVAIPKGLPPNRAVPLVVALHGMGSDPSTFAGKWLQATADSEQFALISVSGTLATGPKGYIWSEDVERDNARVEKAVATLSGKVTIAEGKIVLLGFSQGAQMALELAARYPNKYIGAIAFSPGSRTEAVLGNVAPLSLTKHRFVITAGAGEAPVTIARTTEDTDRLRRAGGEVYHKIYPELRTHSRPPDFEKALPAWLRFVLEGTPLK
ncbi:MAG: hypothetical protein IPK82_39770 [Polyangiaceae bacterium]|nr:hypothetical protein [Polyangiaceae bacterium]